MFTWICPHCGQIHVNIRSLYPMLPRCGAAVSFSVAHRWSTVLGIGAADHALAHPVSARLQTTTGLAMALPRHDSYATSVGRSDVQHGTPNRRYNRGPEDLLMQPSPFSSIVGVAMLAVLYEGQVRGAPVDAAFEAAVFRQSSGGRKDKGKPGKLSVEGTRVNYVEVRDVTQNFSMDCNDFPAASGDD